MSFLHEFEIPDHVFPFDWDEEEELRKYLSTTCLSPEPPSSAPSTLSNDWFDSLMEEHSDPSTEEPWLVLPPVLLSLGLEEEDSPNYSSFPEPSLCNPVPVRYLDGIPFLVVSPSCYTNSGSSASSNPIALDDSDENTAQETLPALNTQREGETAREKPIHAYLRQRRATRVASPAESAATSPTEASTSSPPTRPSVKRKREASTHPEETSDDEETSLSAVRTTNGRFQCKWGHIFGGDCEQSFAMPQEHDKHAVTHIPNADGTLVTLFKCRTCVQKWTERRQSCTAKGGRYSIKKTEFGMFPRKDSCWRHINSHANESGIPADSLLMVDEAPWWWPEYVFLTDTHKNMPRQEKPGGETRSSKRVLQDIIAAHPSVINKPHDPLLAINNGTICYCEPEGHHLSKRRRMSHE